MKFNSIQYNSIQFNSIQYNCYAQPRDAALCVLCTRPRTLLQLQLLKHKGMWILDSGSGGTTSRNSQQKSVAKNQPGHFCSPRGVCENDT